MLSRRSIAALALLAVVFPAMPAKAQAPKLKTVASFSILAEGELNTVAYGSLLKAKKLVAVRGAGNQFSGNYYVQRVRHEFTGDGHLQKFSLKRSNSIMRLRRRNRFFLSSTASLNN